MSWFRTVLLSLMIYAVSLSALSTLDRVQLEEPTIEILVAQPDLNVGDLIRQPETQFARKRVRQGDAPEDAITSFADLTDRILKRSLRKGDPITQLDLYPSDDALSIPEGFLLVDYRIESHALPGAKHQLDRKRVHLWQVLHLPNGMEVKTLLARNVLVVFPLCSGFGRDTDSGSEMVCFVVHVDGMCLPSKISSNTYVPDGHFFPAA